MIKEFNAVDLYRKKKRGETFLKRDSNVMVDVDKLIDIFLKSFQEAKKIGKNITCHE